jgi:hypothetical protein
MRKNLNLLVLLTGLLLFITYHGSAQSSVTFGADLMSRYIWRGLDLGGKSPAIQPNLKYAYISKNEKHCVSLGGWGSYTLNGTANDELDLTLGYTWNKMVGVMVTDYFFPGLNTGDKDKYFIWNADSTGHVLEGCVMFTGNNKIPVTAMFAINVYGNDARRMENDSTTGNIAMSKYLEVGFVYAFKQFDFNAWIGAALDKPDTAFAPTGYYMNDKAGIINAGVKAARSFKLNDHLTLPVQTQFIFNPMLQKAYLVFGISLAFNS